jgi:biopolymer transport protein ExbB
MKKSIALLILGLLGLPQACWAWWNEDWNYRTQITLDPGRLAVPPGESLTRVPLLVRLHEGNFAFLDARSDGTDLRFFADDDQTPLNYHIETFDGVASLAYIWVDVPSVEPGKPQHIWLYYGNERATGVSNAPATYDGETALVYHFNETAGPPRDQTANGNNAVSSNAMPSFEALIRQGAQFNGNMHVRVAPSASLSLPAGAPFSWSAWIKPEAERPQTRAVVFTKLSAAGETSPARLLIGLDQNRPFVRVVDAAGNGQEAIASSPVQLQSWLHLSIVVSDAIRLYVNGVEAAVLMTKLPELGGESTLGADSQTLAAAGLRSVAAGASTGFIGSLDELVISNSARTPQALAFAAATQGRDASFMSFAPKAEIRGDWFSGGYFTILLSAVTVDGWVVIALLGVMLIISVFVIWGRLDYVRRVDSANKGFLREFQELYLTMARQKQTGNLGVQPIPTTPVAAKLGDSSIFRIYGTGAAEIEQRIAMATAMAPFSIDSQTAESLRASLDSAQIREQQLLNKQMVFLTIAISGGPFLGLLGTVVGVMITFASIAAAGDVNVNAIAPGVAAALMATVAGLAVAIPALFAYNYLTTRIRDITAEMAVFANEFVSKMTELYRRQS